MTRYPTPTEALGAALHFLRDDGHDCREGCPVLAMDTREAEDIVTALGAIGWHLAADVGLPETAPRGREGELVLTDFTEQVLYLVVAHGPLPTNDLNALYQGMTERAPGLFPKRSWDTPRKRLSELEAAGFVRQVLRADGKQQTRNGYGVWEATEKGRLTAPAWRAVA